MSGIARVAFDQGMRVSGTDLKESRYTKQLREAGIEVHIGHDPANIPEGKPRDRPCPPPSSTTTPNLAAAKRAA